MWLFAVWSTSAALSGGRHRCLYSGGWVSIQSFCLIQGLWDIANHCLLELLAFTGAQLQLTIQNNPKINFEWQKQWPNTFVSLMQSVQGSARTYLTIHQQMLRQLCSCSHLFTFLQSQSNTLSLCYVVEQWRYVILRKQGRCLAIYDIKSTTPI